jgi:hypothetical protein
VTNINNQTVVAGLTDSSPVARATHDAAVAIEPDLQQTPTPIDTSTTMTDATDLTSKRGGRPNGSTVGAINAQKTLVPDALDECAIEIALKCTTAEKSHRLGNDKIWCVPKGAYDKAVAEVCEKYNVERSEIAIEMALSRIKAGQKLKVNHWGTDSPMIGIAAHLLAAILRRAAIHHPVYCGDGLVMEAQLALVEWKKNNLKNGPNDNSFGMLGQRYWKIFCRWNADVVNSKKAFFDSKRDDWCRLEKILICTMEYITNCLNQGWQKC